MSNRNFKLNMSNIGLLAFPLSVNDSSIPPSAQDRNLGIIFHFTPSFTPHINPISNIFSLAFRIEPNTFSFSFRIDHSSLQPPLLTWASYNYYSPRTASKGISWLSFLGASNSIFSTQQPDSSFWNLNQIMPLCSKSLTSFPLTLICSKNPGRDIFCLLLPFLNQHLYFLSSLFTPL